MTKRYYVNQIKDAKFFGKLGLERNRYKVFGLFDSNRHDGEGSAMGWYAREFLINTRLLACGIQSGFHDNEKDFPFILTLSRKKPKKYKKIYVDTLYNRRYIIANSDEEAIRKFKNMEWLDSVPPEYEEFA